MARAKRMIELVSVPLLGDTLARLCRRRRWASIRNWDFWRGLLSTLKQEMLATLQSPLNTTYDVAFVLELLLTYSFAHTTVENHSFPLSIKETKPKTYRGPPKRFIPTPKTEIGGCARSDTAHP